MEGLSAIIPSENQSNMLQQMNDYNIHKSSAQSPLKINVSNTSELTSNRQAVVARLKKRMDLYRSRQDESIPRFDETFSGMCEQQEIETNILQKRFVESKTKRVVKKTDKKQTDLMTTNNITVVSIIIISSLLFLCR